jgi:hypothetical protein
LQVKIIENGRIKKKIFLKEDDFKIKETKNEKEDALKAR